MNISKQGIAKLVACGFLAASVMFASAPIALAKTATKTATTAKKKTVAKKTTAKKKTTTAKKKVTPAKTKSPKSPGQGTEQGTKSITSTTKKVIKETVPTAGDSTTIDATQEATQSVVVNGTNVPVPKVAKVKKTATPKAAKTAKITKPKKVKVPAASTQPVQPQPPAVSPDAVGLPRGDSPPASIPVTVTTAQPADPSDGWSTDPGLGFTPQVASTAAQQAITATVTQPNATIPSLSLGSILGSSFVGILVAVKRIFTGM